jgi:uncharacterized protein
MEQNMKSVKKEEKQFAVITGASQGLGKALAIELARQKINLILVSLPDQELNKIARQIAFDFQVETHC